MSSVFFGGALGMGNNFIIKILKMEYIKKSCRISTES